MIIIFVLLLLLSYISAFQLDPDLGWHLYLGKTMLDNKSLVTTFVGYNRLQNLGFVDHEWLSNLLFYSIFRFLGYWGLVVLFFLLTTLAFWLIYLFIKKGQLPKATILCSLFVLFLSAVNTYGVRFQIILIPGAAILLCVKKFIKKFYFRLVLYFLTFLIGNNLHGGFLLLILLPVMLEGEIFFSSGSFVLWKKILRLFSVLATIFLAVIINPFCLHFWSLVGQYISSRQYQNQILEWLPIYQYPTSLLVIFLLATIIFVFTINQYWKKLKLNEFILLLIFLVLAIRFRRFFFLFVLIQTPYFALALNDLLILLRVDFKKAKIVAKILILVIIVFFILFALKKTNTKLAPWADTKYPQKAADFIQKNHPQTGNFLNPYNWGGYLIWTNQNIPIFIDGRSPQTTIDGNKTIIGEFTELNTLDNEELEDFLKKYDISYTLIQKPTKINLNILEKLAISLNKKYANQINSQPQNLTIYLEKNPSWQKVYEDDISIIYFKK